MFFHMTVMIQQYLDRALRNAEIYGLSVSFLNLVNICTLIWGIIVIELWISLFSLLFLSCVFRLELIPSPDV